MQLSNLFAQLRLPVATLLLSVGANHSTAAGDAYPDRPLTLIVPTAPAGGTDVVARLFADRLGKALGQPVIVENRAGANGMLGTQIAAHAKPDGYTLLFTYSGAQVANPNLYKTVPYDPVKDFEPISEIALGGNILLVGANFPAKSAKEFVDYAKAHPGTINYCSWGIGSGGHLSMESFAQEAGIVLNHIPYKGSSPCIQDLMGGQVQAAFGDSSTNIGFIKAGKLRGLLYSGPGRMPMLPDVPTMEEAGYAFKMYSWYGVFAPAKTPRPIVVRLNAELNKLLADPQIKARMLEFNLADLPIKTPEQFGAVVRQDLEGWGKLIRDHHIQID
jgi:tripartite-type tricarboxylate transporter receptor subunit TctC